MIPQQQHNDPLVKDIDPAARRWIEGAIGRPVADDERVYVAAYRPAELTEKSRHYEARERLRQLMDAAAANAQRLGVTEQEIDAAIEEAIDHVRGRSSRGPS